MSTHTSSLSHPVRPVARPSAAAFRRRRVATGVLGLVLVVLTAQGADAVAAGLRSSGPSGPTVTTIHYRVRAGDTLWGIARRIAPNNDPREVVDLLVQAHGSAVIAPGDVIDWAGV